MAYSSEKAKARRQRRRSEWLAANGPCQKCGSSEDLEIDHIDPATKDHQIYHSIWDRSKTVRDAELNKCQVLCTACHQEKTRPSILAAAKKRMGPRPDRTVFAEILTLTCVTCQKEFQRKARVERSVKQRRLSGPYCGPVCKGSHKGPKAYSQKNKSPETQIKWELIRQLGTSGERMNDIVTLAHAKHEVVKRVLIEAGIPVRYHGESERKFKQRLEAWKGELS